MSSASTARKAQPWPTCAGPPRWADEALARQAPAHRNYRHPGGHLSYPTTRSSTIAACTRRRTTCNAIRCAWQARGPGSESCRRSRRIGLCARRLPTPTARAYAGLADRAGMAGDLAGTSRRGGRRIAAGLCPARTKRAFGVRNPRARLRAGALSGLHSRVPRGVFLQGSRRLPVVHHQAHGSDGGASGRPGHSASADAAVGVVCNSSIG